MLPTPQSARCAPGVCDLPRRTHLHLRRYPAACLTKGPRPHRTLPLPPALSPFVACGLLTLAGITWLPLASSSATRWIFYPVRVSRLSFPPTRLSSLYSRQLSRSFTSWCACSPESGDLETHQTYRPLQVCALSLLAREANAVSPSAQDIFSSPSDRRLHKATFIR